MSQKSAVPKALQSQVDKAHAHLGHTGNDTATPPATPPAQLASDLAPSPATPPAPSPAPAQPAAAPAAPASAGDDVAALRADMATLRASLDTLKGKYNAEVVSVQEENANLRRQIQQLLNAQQPQQQPKPAAPSATPDAFRAAMEELQNGVGPDLMRPFELVIRHIAREEAMGVVGSRIERVESVVQDVRAKTLDERLAEIVPDFRAIEQLQVWQNYLRGEDPASGMQRLELIEAAYSGGSIQRVAWFFNDFKRLHPGASAAAVAPDPNGAPPSPAAPAHPSLSDLAVPSGMPSGAAPPASKAKRTWKRETRDLFSRLRGQRQPWNRIPELVEAGLTGSEAEAKWLETEFQQAAVEGRLR
jgi:hypothetical protein